MRTIFAFIFVFLLGIGLANAAGDPRNLEGYGKTTWGMTPDEVLTAEAPRAEKLDKQEHFNTGLSMVTIKDIQIQSAKFGAIFIFDGSKQTLRQVNLTSAEKRNPEVNALAFSNVEKLLTQKYGPPAYKEAAKTVSWKLRKTSIELSHLNIAGVVSQVTVMYKPIAELENAAKDL